MLTSEQYINYNHLSGNASGFAHEIRPQYSVSPNNLSVISKNLIKHSVNKNINKSNVKKILYSNIMSNFKEDIVKK